MTSKIFGIGLPKTGTHSLHAALEILGYSSIHYPVSWSEIDHHNAASDISVACRFAELDKLYPGSKFILTVREIDKWLDSCHFHFHQKVNPARLSPQLKEFLLGFRLKAFGTVIYDRLLFEKAYEKHLNQVKNYFDGRPDDLLIINIGSGNEWPELCNFLAKTIPDRPFPHHNMAGECLSEMFQDMAAKLEKNLVDLLN